MIELNPTPNDILLTHDRQLWQARFSPCGKYLFGCGYETTVSVWGMDGDAPRPLAPLPGHNGWVQCLVFAQEHRVLTADSWGRLTCWNGSAEPFVPVWTLEQAHPGWIRALAVSPDGALVATGGNDTVVRIRSVADGAPVRELPHPHRVYSLDFHPDGKSLVTGDLEGVIRHWDHATATEVRRLDASQLYAHATAPERIQHCGGVRILRFNPSGNRLACGGQKEPQGGFAQGTPCVIVYDWESGTALREMPMGSNEDGFAYDVQFHPDGFVMATSSAFPGKGHVWFWRPEEEQAFYSTGKLPNGRSLSLHPDGRRVAFLSSDSANANGRPLKDGEYAGGKGVIRILAFR